MYFSYVMCVLIRRIAMKNKNKWGIKTYLSVYAYLYNHKMRTPYNISWNQQMKKAMLHNIFICTHI